MDSISSETGRPAPIARVSVILPTYNRERYLPEAIASVLAQTFRDFELIIVDDGSTDSTAALVGAITDNRMRHVAIPHRGICTALNGGLREARGEFIARLDSDDVFLPAALTTLVDALDASPGVEVVWAKGQLMSPEGCELPRWRGWPEHYPGEMLRSLVYEDCTTSPGMLIRRKCFERVGAYDESLASSEDWDMTLRLARHFRFQFIDQVVVRIREHDDSITGRRQRVGFLERRTAPLDKLFRDPELAPSVAAMKPIAYAQVYIFRARILLLAGDFAAASREFARALKVSGRPISTAVAIAWWTGPFLILDRSGLGRSAMAALERFGRRLREYRQSRAESDPDAPAPREVASKLRES